MSRVVLNEWGKIHFFFIYLKDLVSKQQHHLICSEIVYPEATWVPGG